MTPGSLSLLALDGIPEVTPGMALAPLIVEALERHACPVASDDVLLVCQKIVSKSEGRFVDLGTVRVSERASRFGGELRQGSTPGGGHSAGIHRGHALCSASADRAASVGILAMANAGVDQSNVPDSESRVSAAQNPDESAAALREALSEPLGSSPAVVITDTFGRPWRQGVCGTAIGASGIATPLDRRGERDRFGRKLKVTQVAIADGIAAAATLLMGEGGEGRPVVFGARFTLALAE